MCWECGYFFIHTNKRENRARRTKAEVVKCGSANFRMFSSGSFYFLSRIEREGVICLKFNGVENLEVWGRGEGMK